MNPIAPGINSNAPVNTLGNAGRVQATVGGLPLQHAQQPPVANPRMDIAPQWVREYTAPPRAKSFPRHFIVKSENEVILRAEIEQRRPKNLSNKNNNWIHHAMLYGERSNLRIKGSTHYPGGKVVSFLTWPHGTDLTRLPRAEPTIKVKVHITDELVHECMVTDLVKDRTSAAYFRSSRAPISMPDGRNHWTTLPLEIQADILTMATVPGNLPGQSVNQLLAMQIVDRAFNTAAAYLLSHDTTLLKNFTARKIIHLANHAGLSNQAFSDAVDELLSGQERVLVDLAPIHEPAKRQIVANRLAQCTNLRELDFRSNNTRANAPGLIAALSTLSINNPRLEKVNLELKLNDLAPDDMRTISNIPGLHSLDVSSNDIGTIGVQHLNNSPTLTKLNASDCSLNADSIAALANTTIETLILHDNLLPHGSAIPLGENRSVKVLDLENNLLGPRDAIALSHNTTIVELNVNQNNFGPAGAAAIANNNTTLTHLSIRFNGIANLGVQAFSANTTLQWLDAGDNHLNLATRLNDDCTQSLVDHPSIRTLILSRSDIGDVGAQRLASSTTLQEVDLRQTLVRDNGALAFRNNNSLEKVNLSVNNISQGICTTLINAHPNRTYLF